MLLLKGRTASFQEKQILEVIPRSGPLDDYVVKNDKARARQPGRVRAGRVVRQNQLADLAGLHYEAALGPTGRSSRPTRSSATSSTTGSGLADELRQAQGLVKYRGKWISEEEQAKRGRRPRGPDPSVMAATDQAPAAGDLRAPRTVAGRPRTS